MNFKLNVIQVVVCCILTLHTPKGLALLVNETNEYKLRRTLLENMDVMVRPVVSSSDAVNVSLSVSVWKLDDLDGQRQILTTSVWIYQKWHNPFLEWNKNDYGGVDRIHVSPKEIWVPDIVILNNGHPQVHQAGHTELFKNWVVLHSNGTCMWDSRANVQSQCNVHVQSFPYDAQNCSLVLGSATYGSELLNIHSIQERDQKEWLKQSIQSENGEWQIKDIYEETYSTQMKERGNSAQKFSLAIYTLEIKRRPLYYVMLLVMPCILSTLLALASFAIPAENGERIGLCSTVLISVSVYLLIIAEILPEKSDTLPILAVYYTITMIGIALVIMATILVLGAHHSEREPPACFKSLYRKNKPKRKKEMKRSVKRNAVSSRVDPMGSDANATARASVDHEPVDVKNFLADDEPTEPDDKRQIWRFVAVLFDRILFWLFLIMFVVSTAYLVIYRAGVFEQNF